MRLLVFVANGYEQAQNDYITMDQEHACCAEVRDTLTQIPERWTDVSSEETPWRRPEHPLAWAKEQSKSDRAIRIWYGAQKHTI